MNKPEFKLLPCVFCTLGYNAYVAGHRFVYKTTQLLTNDSQTNTISDQLTTVNTSIQNTTLNSNKTIG